MSNYTQQKFRLGAVVGHISDCGGGGVVPLGPLRPPLYISTESYSVGAQVMGETFLPENVCMKN